MTGNEVKKVGKCAFFPSQMTEHRVYRIINDSLKVVKISILSISPRPFFFKTYE